MQEGAAQFEHAVGMRPEVLAYRFDLNMLLWDAAQGSPPSGRPLVYGRAVEVAMGGVRLHPLHPEAYWLLGTAELMRIRKGRLDRIPAARMAFEAASALDPGYARVGSALREICKLQKGGSGS